MRNMMPIVGQEPTSPEPRTDRHEVETELRTHRRFDRAARLIGEPALHRLMKSRVVVFGMGGVGSFAAEALSRNAVGELVLVDFDDVCVTNTNRQLHAMKGNIGRRKVDIMAERCAMIHPTGKVTAIAKFYNAESSDELLDGQIDFAVDAIDNMTAKAHLIATCIARKIPIVSSMGAAARLDPTRVRTADLSETEMDPFARSLRKLLREKHAIECKKETGPVGVTAVFSDETPVAPSPISYDAATGFVCVCPNNENGLHTCEKRSRIDGSAAFVTGTFGLVCASIVVRTLSQT